MDLRCKVCERPFRVIGEIAQRDDYICDHCRMRAGRPRVMQDHLIKFLDDWHETGRMCESCGSAIWRRDFCYTVDREVQTAENDIMIKPANEPMQAKFCPNPLCDLRWEVFADSIPKILFPPWAQVRLGVYPEVDDLVGKLKGLEQDRSACRDALEIDKLKMGEDEKRAEIGMLFHYKWWEDYERAQKLMRSAGKGGVKGHGIWGKLFGRKPKKKN